LTSDCTNGHLGEDLSHGADAEPGRQARFADALASREFAFVYSASVLSWAGDYVARAAVTALVYSATHSVLLSALAFAISYAPYLLGGSLLVSLAERYPARPVMITCDLVRMALMATIALGQLEYIPAVMLLLLASALASPPFDAARSATLPTMLTGDRYVVGLALLQASAQPVQVIGYLGGATLAAFHPHVAIGINAITFAVSALLIRLGVRWREGALAANRRTRLLRETGDGIRLVFGTPVLRTLILIVFCGAFFAIVPEGLGAAWAAEVDARHPGLAQGWIMAAVPLGSIVGSLTVTRLIRPSVRPRLLRPLAVAVPLALVPSLVHPPTVVVATIAGLCGFAVGGLIPVANGEFVRHLPKEFRARAFGVVQAGLQLLQGAAVLATGALARQFSVASVAGVWSLGGVVLVLALLRPWAPLPVLGAAAAPMSAQVPGTMEP
jgi:MFS family permease